MSVLILSTIRPGFVLMLWGPGYYADLFGVWLSTSEFIFFDGDVIVSGGSLTVSVLISIYLRLDIVLEEMLFYYLV